MKMHPSVLNTFLIACCLMALVLNGAGKLFVLQEPEIDISNRIDSIPYTCISEDDRMALVWNNLPKYYDQKQHEPEEFRSIRARNMAECALVESENCIAYWKKSDDWNIVNSRDHPTGPVFDSRWEDFAETSFRDAYHDRENYQYVMKMTESGDVVFSVRGFYDINIRICKKNNMEDGWCSTITLRTRLHTIGNYIDYCMFTDFGTTNQQPCINTDQTAQSGKIFFSKQLWRTFIFKWNVGNIKVCNEFECLFKILLHQDSTLQDKYFFMNMDDEGLLRFHFYDYLLITKKDTALESDKFHHNGQNLCFEFIVGLCDGCSLEIFVVDENGRSEWLTSISQARSSPIDELLTWQRVELDKLPKYGYVGHLSFKVITKLSQSNSQPQWAIDTSRKCKSPDAERELTFKTVVLEIPSEVPPLYYCQKMSYNIRETLIVNSYLTTPLKNISASMQEYLRKTSYSQAPCPSNWWKRTLICDQSGCVCIEKSSNSIATGPKLLGVNPNKTNFGLHGTSNFSLRDETVQEFADEKTLPEQTETWLVILSILVVCLLLPYLVIWYRRHKESRVRRSHLQGVTLNQPYVNSDNSRVKSSRAEDLSSDPVYTEISENVEEQTMHVYDVSSEPVNLTILKNLREQKSHEENFNSEPLYMAPIDPREQTNNAQEVPLVPVYMNISDNSSVQSSHAQNILLSGPVYTEILENVKEQTIHVHDDSVYLTILDDSSERASHKQNVPFDPLYMTPIDPREQTNNAQEVSLAPVYMNVPNNLEEQASHK